MDMPAPSFTADPLIAADIRAFLTAHRHKQLLRFITCGSVDDGKSTLIGRLLFDCGAVFDDQLTALAADSKRVGTQGAALDLALLVDGLTAEREQGITIDVAYRFFATPARKFIVADCPGHAQYTRNMVTGASSADLAILLVDARGGMLTQTRRHAYLARMIGVRHFVLAINKMDLVGWDQAIYDRICAEFAEFAGQIGISGAVTAIPLSGLTGDNVTAASTHMPWFAGPTLLAALEAAPLANAAASDQPLRLPVQWVNRPNPDFRGFAGQIAAGQVRPGDAVRLLPSGQTSRVAAITSFDGDLDVAVAGQSVTLRLADEVDCSRGDMIVTADDAPEVADQFEARLVWMDDRPLVPGRAYWLKLATQMVAATVKPPKYTINVDTLDQLAAKTLALNDIGVAEIAAAKPLIFEPFAASAALGGFILIDQISNATVAAGMLNFALRRATNVHRQPLSINRADHAALKNQTPKVLWFTGLSGAGKSTIANALAAELHLMNRHIFLLDGDNLRHGLNRDLGFTEADRVENIRRAGAVARLMADAGLIVLAAFISPFRADRAMVRAMMEPGEFVEIHVDTPLAVAEARDAKGLYAKARAGKIRNFTGIDSPYEPPEAPDIRINTTDLSPQQAARAILAQLLPLK